MAVDMKTINRAKMVERLADAAIEHEYGWDKILSGDGEVLNELVDAAKCNHFPSDTVWAMLVIRLGGDL